MTDNLERSPGQEFRSLFISDIHLGSRHCQAEALLDFLARHRSENLYLVGDIIDGWKLKKRWYWPKAHDDLVDEVLRRARLGVKVFYIPGNHDEFVRKFIGRRLQSVEVLDQSVHEMADGRRYLVLHGDRFDVVVNNARWMAYLGDQFYEFALSTNTWLNQVRGFLGLKYWSLGAFAKRHVKSFVSIIGQFESAVSEEVRGLGLDGVICGHIHHAESRELNGLHYVNTGDWVESCTAVAEHHDGTLELIFWTDRARTEQHRAEVQLVPEIENRAR